MKGLIKVLIVVLVGALVLQPMTAMAGSSSRVIPLGKASFVADGKTYSSEAPLRDGVLMACREGNCMVQSRGFQLVAHNKSVFGVSEGDQRWDVILKNGALDFGIKADAKPVMFNTPHDMVQIQEAIVPAGSDGIARGTLTVTKNGTEVSAQQGMFRVATRNGEQLVRPGQSIVLAQADAGAGGADKDSDDLAGGAIGANGGASGAGDSAVGASGGVGAAPSLGGTIAGVPTSTFALAGGIGAGVIGGTVAAISASKGDDKDKDKDKDKPKPVSPY